jgi:DNA-binding NarL/FixJ family response regulator
MRGSRTPSPGTCVTAMRLLRDVAAGGCRRELKGGEWLRREHRRVDARAHLRVAHDMFAGFGAEAFAERARRELLATGETVRRRTVQTVDELTAQEAQIAQLARDGQTNPQIGAQCSSARARSSGT